jgi:ABC-2 type transport system permease protein
VLLFGSVFMAIGASINQIKEAQGMLLPVWLLFMYPMFVWFQIVKEPNGGFATWLSFVPPGIPLLMVLRIAATDAVPLWQPVVGGLIMVVFTLAVVAAAGRVFRIGILASGKTPSLLELLRWATRG